VLVVTRYRVAASDEAGFAVDAERALIVLTEREGCLAAILGRNVDDPELWTLTTRWRSVGDYRRALSHYEVKLHAVPVMYRAIEEPSAYEPTLSWDAQDGHRWAELGRAPDADRAGPGSR
jgi:quinol monooxygenase YgiN